MRIAPLALGVVLALGASACSGGSEPDTGRGEAEPQSKILQPGRPGEGNETLDPDTTLESAPWNDADAAFMSMMVPHHAQALEMSRLARSRAGDERVASLARRIEGAQGPEIRSMASWLAARELPVPSSMDDLEGHDGHDGHDGQAMVGMLTSAQMTQLARARGDRFDRLFLSGMIQHHRGAVDMAATEMRDGSDVIALELAGDIATGQQAEIGRMQQLRRTL